jgi:hypothetical protein
MEIFCRNKIILAILTFPLTEIKIIDTRLINHLLYSIVYYATIFINGTLDTRFMLGTSEA